MYVGMDSHTPMVEDEKAGKENKDEVGGKSVKKSKNCGRKIEDGLLAVVPVRIYGRRVRAVIDSEATRCFVTPSCVTAMGLKGIPQDIFLELRNG